ncbi:MAG TPA: hypothetical protein P5556_03150 [Candidatus Gastranaerophilales bacterium]|nr:hypothetical protein [Candidatus Gastranaerophilales bacterium]
MNLLIFQSGYLKRHVIIYKNFLYKSLKELGKEIRRFLEILNLRAFLAVDKSFLTN